MPFAKAIVPILVAPVLFVLESFGVTPDMSVEQALTFVISTAVTAILVYAVPNKTK